MFNEHNNDDELYKDADDSNAAGSIEALLTRLGKNAAKLKDPVVLASLLYTSKTERERSNKLFMTLIQKIDLLTRRIEKLETTLTMAAPGGAEQGEPLLPEIDQQILGYVRQKGTTCAEEIQKRFNYRGTNAASARLNRLCRLGVLVKVQVGRKVFFKVQ